MPFRKRSRKPRSARSKPRRRINHRRTKRSGQVLMNTRYAQIHRLPIAPTYYTTMESEVICTLNNAELTSPIVFNVVPSANLPWDYAGGGTILLPVGGDSGGTPFAQPWTGMEYLADLYQNWQLLASSLSINVTPVVAINDPSTCVMGIIPIKINQSNPSASQYNYLYQLSKAPWGKSITCTQYRGARLSSYIKTTQLYGVSKVAMKIDNANYDTLASATTASPPVKGIAYEVHLVEGNLGGGTAFQGQLLIRMKLKGFFKFYGLQPFNEVENP